MKHEMIGERRKSRFDPHLAERIEAWDRELTIKEEAERLRREREDRLKPKVAEPEPKPAEEAKVASGSGYILMDKANTYALGVHALRDACDSAHPTFTMKDGSVVYRPLTFEENIRARLDDYYTFSNSDGSKRSIEDRKRLFGDWLDSCTGIAYKEGSTLFKIITQTEDLINIGKGFNGKYHPVAYSQLQGVELDSRKMIFTKNHIYGELLTEKQVLKHPAWNAAVADRQLLKDYAELVFRMKEGNNMAFLVRQNTSDDELRALYVDLIDDYSVADGNGGLYYGGRFVRVAPARNLIAYSQML